MARTWTDELVQMQVAFKPHDKTDSHFQPYHPNINTSKGTSRLLGLPESKKCRNDAIYDCEAPYYRCDDNVR